MDFLKHLKHFLKQTGSGRGAQRPQQGAVPRPFSGVVGGLLLASEVPPAPLLGEQHPGCCSSARGMLCTPCTLRVLCMLTLHALHPQHLHLGFPRPSLAPRPAFEKVTEHWRLKIQLLQKGMMNLTHEINAGTSRQKETSSKTWQSKGLANQSVKECFLTLASSGIWTHFHKGISIVFYCRTDYVSINGFPKECSYQDACAMTKIQQIILKYLWM